VEAEIAGRQADLLKQAKAEAKAKEEGQGSIEDFRE
jgi:hypothetical protein